MNFVLSVCWLLTIVRCQRSQIGVFDTFPTGYFKQLRSNADIDDSELVVAFVIFRHGDRMPDPEELELYPEAFNKSALFPFGPTALTNRGKKRAYHVGTYLRRRYDNLVNRLYIAEEVLLWSTDYDRTKMSILAAMAGMYPPPPPQRWNNMLDWQPVPYNTLPRDEDDMVFWFSCPHYFWVKEKIYKLPEVHERIAPYEILLEYLSNTTSVQIDKPYKALKLSNLFQTLLSADLPVPRWAMQISEEIKNITRLDYDIQFYTKELIQLSTGVLIGEIQKVMKAFINGHGTHKLRIYSGHQTNVAALMAAVGVFDAHQPPYGSTFSLELRRSKSSGNYGVVAVYAWDPKDNGRVLPMADCKENLFCDFDTFLRFTSNYAWSKDDFKNNCLNPQSTFHDIENENESSQKSNFSKINENSKERISESKIK